MKVVKLNRKSKTHHNVLPFFTLLRSKEETVIAKTDMKKVLNAHFNGLKCSTTQFFREHTGNVGFKHRSQRAGLHEHWTYAIRTTGTSRN